MAVVTRCVTPLYLEALLQTRRFMLLLGKITSLQFAASRAFVCELHRIPNSVTTTLGASKANLLGLVAHKVASLSSKRCCMGCRSDICTQA